MSPMLAASCILTYGFSLCPAPSHLRVPASPRLRVPASPRLRVPLSPRLRVPVSPPNRHSINVIVFTHSIITARVEGSWTDTNTSLPFFSA